MRAAALQHSTVAIMLMNSTHAILAMYMLSRSRRSSMNVRRVSKALDRFPRRSAALASTGFRIVLVRGGTATLAAWSKYCHARSSLPCPDADVAR
jgi:hypothetical protein